jgi:hypothetical protein
MKPSTREIHDFLIELRDSGETNMWGASSYLEDEFNMCRSDAKEALLDWIKSMSATVQKNHEVAYGIYEKSGQSAVFDAVNNGMLDCDEWSYCGPCEIESPFYEKACLVCATPSSKS